MEQYETTLSSLNAILDIQLKNMEAFAEAGQMAFENYFALIKHQTEFFSEIVKDSSLFMRKQAGPTDLEMVQEACKKSAAHCQELVGIISKSGQKTSEVINNRVASSLKELKSIPYKKNSQNGSQKNAA